MSKVILRKYGESATFHFDLFEIDGVDFKVDASHVSGDTKIMKDEGAEENTDNGFTDEGQGYSIIATSDEMELARGKIYIADQGTKAWLDTSITIETYGHASAQHPYMNEGIWDRKLTGATHNVPASSGRRLRAVGDATSGSIDDASATTTTFITDLVGAHADHYADQTILFTSGSLTGMSRSILSYNEIDKELTVEEDLPEAPASGDDFDISPVHVHPVSQIASVIWDEILISETHNVSNSAGKRLRELKEIAGYAGGFIYIDTVDGTTGGESFVNGTLDNPVSNMTDANILSDNLNIHDFKVTAGSSILFNTSQEKQSFIGENWTLALGGQNVSGSFFCGATLSGMGTGAIPLTFEHCDIGAVTLPPCKLKSCGLTNGFTIGAAGTFIFDQCYSAVAGVSAPSIDYGAAIGDSSVNMRHYSGGIEVKQMGVTGTDKMSIEGDGQVIINANSIGGTIAIRGHQDLTGADAFVAAGGIISDDARFTRSEVLEGIEASTILAKQDTLQDMHDEAFGKWVLDPSGDTLTLYKADGVTVLKIFDLTDTAQAVPAYIGRTPQ